MMKSTPENRNYFIVGNSRSGTTMMMRILGQHSAIHAINEPHFFETMWAPKDQDVLLKKTAAAGLLLKLFTVQRKGFFAPKNAGDFQEEIETLLQTVPDHNRTRLVLFQTFLQYEALQNSKTTPCEKTPQNVFYLKELLTFFPEAKIINMVRDPRSVLLSQKKKWKRKFLGGTFLTWKEMLRLMINYHPLTIGRLWNSSVSAGHAYRQHPSILHLRFEDLLETPEVTVKEVATFLGVDYENRMLHIPYAGSSLEADRKSTKGIRTARADSWKGKLSATEIFFCQLVCRKHMKIWGYATVKVSPNPIRVLWNLIIFPIKIVLAFFVNIKRMRSIFDALQRRLAKS